MMKLAAPLVVLLVASSGVSGIQLLHEDELTTAVRKVSTVFAQNHKLSAFMNSQHVEQTPDLSSSDVLGLKVTCDVKKNANCWKTGDSVKDSLIWLKYAKIFKDQGKKKTDEFTISQHMMDGMKADAQSFLQQNSHMQKDVDVILKATMSDPEVFKSCQDCPGDSCKAMPHIKAQCMIYSMVKPEGADSQALDTSVAQLDDGLAKHPKLSFMAEAQKLMKSGNPLAEALKDPSLTVTCDTKKEPMCWQTGDKKKDALIWLKYSLIWRKINKNQQDEFNGALTEHLIQGVRQDMQNYLEENPTKQGAAYHIATDPELGKKCKKCPGIECTANFIIQAQCMMYTIVQSEDPSTTGVEYH